MADTQKKTAATPAPGRKVKVTPGGGAAAVWTSTEISYSDEAAILNAAYFQALFNPQESFLGASDPDVTH